MLGRMDRSCSPPTSFTITFPFRYWSFGGGEKGVEQQAGGTEWRTKGKKGRLMCVLWISRTTKARDFEGEGGPEDKRRVYEEEHGGNDDVKGNVR